MKPLISLLLFLSVFSFAQKSALKKEISKITAGKKATVAVSVKGIDFPFEFNNENASRKLPMLSVFKFHIALAVLNEVEKGKLSLQQKFLIKKEQLLPDTHSPFRDLHPEGNLQATIDELIYYSVSLSDNNTTDILLQIIGGPKTVQKFMDARKVKDFQILYNEEEMHRGPEFIYPNHTSVRSLTELYSRFYQNQILNSKFRSYLYEILQKTTTGANKLKEQLPPMTVAHKTGSSGTDSKGLTIAENDSGIITLPDGRHYAVAVFVIDSTEAYETNCRMISDISKAVWDYLVNTKKQK